ncbi:protein phosphatase 2C domain-containing protein [Streptomyces sp. NPDC006367]|uniref:protein phosphatase 2C domain-containing protein n=1 Tax=unclassified Streptomyces TaxID=2593676 RepID=UPI0033B02BF6
MSQQGGRPTGSEDDWWGQLYDDTGDTGPAAAADSLDDRFASAANTVSGPPDAGPDAMPEVVPDEGKPPSSDVRPPWWEPPAPSGFPGQRGDPGLPGPRTEDARAPRPPVTPPPEPPTAPDPRPAEAPAPPPPPPPPPPASSGSLPPPPPPFLPAQPPQPPPPPQSSQPSQPPPPQEAADGDRHRVDEPRTAVAASVRDYVGSGPPTYEAEPTALPPADPDELDGLVPDTVLEGARYGTCTLRAASVRGDSARYRGDPRRDALLVARFGAGERALILVAAATGARGTAEAHRAAAELCRWIGGAVGRSHARLGEDLRAARRDDLKSGLHRLTDRGLGKLRAEAADRGLAPHEYAATLRCLLIPAAPQCRTRVFFGVGAGGLFRLRDGVWQDMEPDHGPGAGAGPATGRAPGGAPEGDRLTLDLGVTAPGPVLIPGPVLTPGPEPAGPAPEPFRFRASVARPGDVLLLCSTGLAEPLRGEPELRELLARRWSDADPPGLTAFLDDSRVRVKGYADDRTAAALWEA